MSNVVKSEAWVSIVENGLDLVMVVGSIVYIALVNETEMELSQQTMAAIGGAGGTLRLLLRRILRKIVQLRLGTKIADPPEDAAPPLEPTPDPSSEPKPEPSAEKTEDAQED